MNGHAHPRPVGSDRGIALLAAVAIALAAGAPATASAADPPRVALRGSLTLPDRAIDGEGRDVPVTGLSGIAWLGDERYVAIMDNSRHLLRFRLRCQDKSPLIRIQAGSAGLTADQPARIPPIPKPLCACR